MLQSPSRQSVGTVRDIMTTPVYSINMDASIRDAKALFDKRRFHHAVVLQRKQVVGVLSDRDVLKVISPFIGNRMMQRSQDLSTLKQRIHQIMSRTLVTIDPDATVAEAARKMLTERVSCLPVVDEDMHLVGILTIRDFLSWAAGAAEA